MPRTSSSFCSVKRFNKLYTTTNCTAQSVHARTWTRGGSIYRKYRDISPISIISVSISYRRLLYISFFYRQTQR